MFTNRKRVLTLMLIAVILNFVLFSATYFLRIPLWLDTVGTIYISCILGSPAGFIVAIINNLTQAIFFYGDKSLYFYFISLLTALIAGKVFEKLNCKTFKKWAVMLLWLLLVQNCFAVFITLVANGGVPSDYWGKYLYESFIKSGLSDFCATSASVISIKIPDVIISVVIVMTAIKLTPQKLKDDKAIIIKNAEEIKK